MSYDTTAGHYYVTAGRISDLDRVGPRAGLIMSLHGDGRGWDEVRPAARKLAAESRDVVTVWHASPGMAFVCMVLPDGGMLWN